jgi:Protein of unknown function (DUF1579)
MLRRMATLALLTCMALLGRCLGANDSSGDPVKNLGAFEGKWHTEGTLANGDKTQSDMECRWTPQTRYLICDQQVNIGGTLSDQLTVYGYEPAAHNYYYSTFQERSFGPSTGTLQIQGNVWTYNSAFERKGKRTQIRTTNEFIDPKTEIFKVAFSDDGGSTWKEMMQGTAHKTGE